MTLKTFFSVWAYLVRFLENTFSLFKTFIAYNVLSSFFDAKYTSPKLPLPNNLCHLKSFSVI